MVGREEGAKALRFTGNGSRRRKRPSRDYRKTLQVTAHNEEQTERWLGDGMKAAGLQPKDLQGLKESEPQKLAMAELLWKKMTVSQEWIAEKLSMRSAANVSQQLRRLDRAKTLKKVPPEMPHFLAETRNSGP